MPNLGFSGFAAPGIGLGTPGFGITLGNPNPSVDITDPATFNAIDAELGLDVTPDLGAVANVDAMGNPLGWSNVAPNPPAIAFNPAPPSDVAPPTPSLGYPPSAPMTSMEKALMGKMNMDIDPHMVVPPDVPTPLQPDKPMVDPNMQALPLQSIPTPPMVMPIAFDQALQNISLAPPMGYMDAFNAPMSMTEALNATLAAMNPSMSADDTSGNDGNEGGDGNGDGDGDGGNEGGGSSGGIGSEGGGGGIGGGGTSGGIGSEGGGGGIGGGGSSGGIGSEGGGGGIGGGGSSGGIGSEGGGGGPGGGEGGDAGGDGGSV